MDLFKAIQQLHNCFLHFFPTVAKKFGHLPQPSTALTGYPGFQLMTSASGCCSIDVFTNGAIEVVMPFPRKSWCCDILSF
jgi:hypothetical protein